MEYINVPISTLPQRNYKVVLADPPWEFKTYSEKGQGKSPQRHYHCESMDDLVELLTPVRNVLHPDGAVLFLWSIWPMIFEAKTIIEAMGFQYSGLAWEWDKFNPATGKRSFGGGYGTRKNLEPCLLGRTKNFKMKTELKNRSVRDLIRSPRREHSRKPDEQYENIHTMFDGPYLELFARTAWAGWDSWGNEVGKFESPVGSEEYPLDVTGSVL